MLYFDTNTLFGKINKNYYALIIKEGKKLFGLEPLPPMPLGKTIIKNVFRQISSETSVASQKYF